MEFETCYLDCQAYHQDLCKFTPMEFETNGSFSTMNIGGV